MATTWTHASSGDPSDAGNWDNGVPAPGNDAVIPLDSFAPDPPDDWPVVTFIGGVILNDFGSGGGKTMNAWTNARCLGPVTINGVVIGGVITFAAAASVLNGVNRGDGVAGTFVKPQYKQVSGGVLGSGTPLDSGYTVIFPQDTGQVLPDTGDFGVKDELDGWVLQVTPDLDMTNFFSDPGISHVELGTIYKFNSFGNNRTGTLVAGGGASALLGGF